MERRPLAWEVLIEARKKGLHVIPKDFITFSLRTGSLRGRKKIRQRSEWESERESARSEWDAGEPVDIIFDASIRPFGD